LADHLRTLQLIYGLRDAWRQRAAAAPAGAGPGVDLISLAEPRDEPWRIAWELTERLLTETAGEAARHQTRFIVLTVSSDVQVHPDEAVREAACRQLGVVDLLYAERRLDQWGRQHGIPVINLAEPMGRYASKNRVYLHGFANTQFGVGHWNAEGNRVAAEIAAATICGK
jgi:hypothetical protein